MHVQLWREMTKGQIENEASILLSNTMFVPVTVNVKNVAGRLVAHYERRILGPVPLTIPLRMYINAQLVLPIFGQLVDFVVPEPEVAGRVTESSLERCPVLVEEVISGRVLLHQRCKQNVRNFTGKCRLYLQSCHKIVR